ncbi:MAG: hypothetical protein H6635_09330 [Anaerolineales bacterium]|nr:hypothetical protein [Anaerolineales bacterium]
MKIKLSLVFILLVIPSLACNYLTRGVLITEPTIPPVKSDPSIDGQVIANLFLTNDLNSTIPMTVFQSTDTVYVVYYVINPQNGSKHEVRWYVLNSPQDDPSIPFNTAGFIANGNRDHFYANLESNEADGLPLFRYKVELYIDNTKVAEKDFTVAK